MHKKVFLIPIVLVTLMSLFVNVPMALAGDKTCRDRVNKTFDKLLECVTVDGVRQHQAAFQAIADANGGTRAAGTPGYDASVAYVVDTLEAAGYDVELNGFDFTFTSLATLQQTAPINATYETGAFTGSASGVVAGPVIPVDLALGTSAWPADPSTATSGCEASDFTGLDFSGPNDIALLQRGACFFSVKAVNAEMAGAEAVIIFNQGNSSTRMGLIVGNASALPDGTPSNLTILVVGASFSQGIALSQTGAAASIDVDPPVEITQYNVLAELPGRDAASVVMVGAHLDSVQGGPGIQDNGSGSAAILETAVQMSNVKPRNTVRFAWWGAAESGLVGSTAYVNGLTQEEQDDIALYLDFEMIGSPNHVFFIFDGDDSDGVGAGPGPAGSAQIEYLFESYYLQVGQPFKGTDFSGRSDYGPFIAVGIPSGGLFTGAEGIKTAEEVALWGGTAGDQYDPCYHLACDTFDNINLNALDINADAVAYSVLQYVMNTEVVNGESGKGNFKIVPDNFGALLE
jgi:Zn-dependent M28 family amino/carboxypeptidase